MSESSHPRIAIVGSGPSGCYLAQALLRAVPQIDLTIFDRLASPFGLVRYGVAADHQHTKAITRQFERLFETPAVRFAGNIEVGRDVTLDELRQLFDAVVLATGLSADAPLTVPGGDLAGVHGSGRIIRRLNSHPDAEEFPEFGSDVVVVGAGNVALDILRFLVKDHDGYHASDVADELLDRYLGAPAERITVLSRSAAAQSKGDPQMLRELTALERASYETPDPVAAPAGVDLDRTESARVAAMSELVSADRSRHPGPRVTLRFGVTPVRILGDGRVTGVELSDGTELPATSIITAIGFRARGAGEFDELVTSGTGGGRVDTGLYLTGWARRGPRGAIPENRADAKAVAEEIAADLASGALKGSPDTLGFDGLPPETRSRAIEYRQWQVLDAHERAEAPADRVRRKIADHDRMVAIARGDRSDAVAPMTETKGHRL